MLANLYLEPFDKAMRSSGYSFLRYADDLALVCSSRKEAEDALEFMRGELGKLKLNLPVLGDPKCRISEFSEEGVVYLGCFLRRTTGGVRIKPDRKMLKGVKESIDDLLSPRLLDPLAHRYSALSGLVKGWLAAYAQMCDVSSERAELLSHAQARLTELLRDRNLIDKASGLTTQQRRFLSVDDLF